MRIIGGEFRSRRLKTLPGMQLRPTPDRLRETLFDVLAPSVEGAVFVDAYAGSGAVGIEALSRGASRAILIESHRAAIGIIEQNVTALQIQDRALVIHGRATQVLRRTPADIVFLDPPYDLESEYREAMCVLDEMAAPLVIAQHSARLVLDEAFGRLRRYRVLRQGDNSLSFYRTEPRP